MPKFYITIPEIDRPQIKFMSYDDQQKFERGAYPQLHGAVNKINFDIHRAIIDIVEKYQNDFNLQLE